MSGGRRHPATSAYGSPAGWEDERLTTHVRQGGQQVQQGDALPSSKPGRSRDWASCPAAPAP
ncbi:hypothetical protein [Streptomyces diastatochromogenes]|uniref:hypothetical protein n=1 Tax=Streptomyces diastatochromogenes TaxID=42236 RepID=UPI003699D323